MGRTGWARPWSLFVLNEWVRCHLDQIRRRWSRISPLAVVAPGA